MEREPANVDRSLASHSAGSGSYGNSANSLSVLKETESKMISHGMWRRADAACLVVEAMIEYLRKQEKSIPTEKQDIESCEAAWKLLNGVKINCYTIKEEKRK